MSETVTTLLRQAVDEDPTAKDQLFRLVQNELRKIAEAKMRGERADHSMQATILVDDAFMRLTGAGVEIDWKNQKHFFRTAARVMRQLLIDHERKRRAQRRGGGQFQRVAVDPDMLGAEQQAKLDMLALNEAVNRLAEIDSRQADVVIWHHFIGRSLSETAELLEVSMSTVKADWRMAKAWLHRELTRDG